jgi:hypothetical protein
MPRRSRVTPKPRVGQGDVKLSREEFGRRLGERFSPSSWHGDAIGAKTLRRSLVDWLHDMHLVQAAYSATIDRYIGYYEPYATSHLALDEDTAVQQEVRNAAKVLMAAVKEYRSGRSPEPARAIREPRPK